MSSAYKQHYVVFKKNHSWQACIASMASEKQPRSFCSHASASVARRQWQCSYGTAGVHDGEFSYKDRNFLFFYPSIQRWAMFPFVFVANGVSRHFYWMFRADTVGTSSGVSLSFLITKHWAVLDPCTIGSLKEALLFSNVFELASFVKVYGHTKQGPQGSLLLTVL